MGRANQAVQGTRKERGRIHLIICGNVWPAYAMLLARGDRKSDDREVAAPDVCVLLGYLLK
jgi:hypothetical protein